MSSSWRGNLSRIRFAAMAGIWFRILHSQVVALCLPVDHYVCVSQSIDVEIAGHLGKLLEDIHVTWTQFGKKRDKIAALREVASKNRLQYMETASQFLATPSEPTRYGVRTDNYYGKQYYHGEQLNASLMVSGLRCYTPIIGKITVVILVRDRCPRGKGNLPRYEDIETWFDALKINNEEMVEWLGNAFVRPRSLWCRDCYGEKERDMADLKAKKWNGGACKQLGMEGGASPRCLFAKWSLKMG
ncbi:hypothetical protein Tco_0765298 [Tanacetum coccineum]